MTQTVQDMQSQAVVMQDAQVAKSKETFEQWAAERDMQLLGEWKRWGEEKERELTAQSDQRVEQRVEEIRQEMVQEFRRELTIRQQEVNMEDAQENERLETQNLRLREMEAELTKMKAAQVSNIELHFFPPNQSNRQERNLS